MEKPASKIEILGDHLHQKIKEMYDGCPDNDNHMEFINKITGILLERSTDDIVKMLTDQTLLNMNVKKAEGFFQPKREPTMRENGDGEVKENDCDAAVANGRSLSSQALQDSIAELLYDRVYQLDSDLASQITGILLELDQVILADLLHDDSKFLKVFERARSCLISSDNVLSGKSLITTTAATTTHTKDEYSRVIYEHVKKMYTDYAPKITGMILELDPKKLDHIVKDRRSMETAITKAYTVLAAANGGNRS